MELLVYSPPKKKIGEMNGNEMVAELGRRSFYGSKIWNALSNEEQSYFEILKTNNDNSKIFI